MMENRHQNLKDRTRVFAVRALRFSEALPRRDAIRVVARQLMRCGTSVGANYRAATRAKSRRDFIAKLGIVEEEADECLFWLEVLRELSGTSDELVALEQEASELLAIVVASKKTARRNA